MEFVKVLWMRINKNSPWELVGIFSTIRAADDFIAAEKENNNNLTDDDFNLETWDVQ